MARVASRRKILKVAGWLCLGGLAGFAFLYVANRTEVVRDLTFYRRGIRKLGFQFRDAAPAARGTVIDPKANWSAEKGYTVTKVAEGFTLPVALSFAQPPPKGDGEPFFYVNEMMGTVKVVAKDGTVTTFAEGLINYRPEELSHSPQNGLMGICRDPLSGGLIATVNYRAPHDQRLYCRVLRLRPNAEGTRCVAVETVFDTYPEMTVPSHTIQQPAIGPDGYLYIPIGDAETPIWAQDMTAYAGKILRMDLQGNPLADNPLAKGIAREPRNYIFAFGLRNPGVLQWNAKGDLYCTDVGPAVDRLVRITKGSSHGWTLPGTDAEMRSNALYTTENDRREVPYGLLYLQGSSLGAHKDNSLLVAMFGAPEFPLYPGGRSIVEVPLNAEGLIGRPLRPLVKNSQWPNGNMHSAATLAEGPDGVYFTDLFGDGVGGDGKKRRAEGKGMVWKIRWDGRTVGGGADHAMSVAGWTKSDAFERGAALFSLYSCAACHAEKSWVGVVGPTLRSDELRKRVLARITSAEYEARLRGYAADTNEHFARYQTAYQEILSRTGPERFKAWLHWRLRDPRFDDVEARMPQFGLTEEEIGYLVKFLMERTSSEVDRF